MYIYIYISIERERDRDMYVYTYVYIYIYIYICPPPPANPVTSCFCGEWLPDPGFLRSGKGQAPLSTCIAILVIYCLRGRPKSEQSNPKFGV